MGDPRAATAMVRYRAVLTQVQAIGEEGFAYVLDTADKDEMDDILIAADVILAAIERAHRMMAQRPAGG